MNFFLQPFIGFCLYFDSLENAVEFGGVMNKTDGIYRMMEDSTWVTTQTKTDFRAVSQRLLHRIYRKNR
uniref:Uncharacterized protein n=1 Tax=Romanomermis culicivorax TaxID=13658 RepID=A0A915KPS6_ROMCU